jgi:hypothetical protein
MREAVGVVYDPEVAGLRFGKAFDMDRLSRGVLRCELSICMLLVPPLL